MCLSFDYAGAVWASSEFEAAVAAVIAEQRFKAKQHDIDCSGTSACCIVHDDYSVSKLFRLAAKSDTSVMNMYPVKREHIGANGEHLVRTAKIPCCVAALDGFVDPTAYVNAPRVAAIPNYRSLGGNDSSQPAPQPVFAMRRGRYVENLDGSKYFTLTTADHVRDEAGIAELIADPNKPEIVDMASYYHYLGVECMKDLLGNMIENKINLSYCFALNEEATEEEIKRDPIAALDPLAYLNFLDQLLPNLLVGHDMIVAIPKFSDEGKPLMDGAFSFSFHYDRFCTSLPILGLIHNDVGDESPMAEVEGDYFLYSNKRLTYSVVDNETNSRQKIKLLDSAEFLPTATMAVHSNTYDHDAVAYRSLGAHQYEGEIDYPAWDKACGAFQNARKDEIWTAIKHAVVDEMKLPSFSTEELYVTNLVGRKFPKHASSLVCDPLTDTITASEMQKNMRKAREKARQRTTEIELARASAVHKTSPNRPSEMDTSSAPTMAQMQAVVGQSLGHIDFMDGSSMHQQDRIRAAIEGLSAEKMTMLVTYVRGINPSFINDQAFGFGYFEVLSMSGQDIKKLVDFATMIK